MTSVPVHPIPRRRFLAGLGGAAFAAAFLAACGESAAGDEEEAAMVTIDDYFGPVTVPADPQRVLAGDSITLGNMLALGVKPVAAPVNRNSLPGYLGDQMDGVEDVTAESGVNLEQSLALNPDLAIIFAGFPEDPWNKENYDRLAAALPTFGYQYGYAYIEEINLNLTEVARVLNRQEQADELIAEYEERVAELRQRVADAGLTDKPVSVIRLSEGGDYSIRIGTSESIAFRALGIPQPEGQQNPDDFSIDVSLERLNLLNEAHTVFIYVDDNAEAERSVVTESAVWQSLEPVKNGRVHFVNSGIWNSIDIIGLMRILDDIEELHIAPAEV